MLSWDEAKKGLQEVKAYAVCFSFMYLLPIEMKNTYAPVYFVCTHTCIVFERIEALLAYHYWLIA